MTTYNVLIVTKTASYVSFRAESFIEAAQRVKRCYGDKPFYDIELSDPVFIAPVTFTGNLLDREQHTVKSLISDLKRKHIRLG